MWLSKGSLWSCTLLLFISQGLISSAPAPPQKPTVIQKFDDYELKADEELRLPKTTKPLWYNIEIRTRVDEGDKKFSGSVEIEIEVLQETNTIVLHSKDLRILSTSLKLVDRDIEVTPNENADYQFLNLVASENLVVGERYKVTVEYEGTLKDEARGFFLRHYYTNGNKVPLASTQFEPVYARLAFVCYDEPEYKASFQLKITHGENYNAVSNTEGSSQNNGDGTVTTTFEPTPPMSTYLLAFTISDFSSEKLDSRPIHITHSRPEAMERTKFALSNSQKALAELEKYLIANYTLKKLSSVALPEFGTAMENWGMVTYDEQFLILDEESSHSQITKSYRLIAHELAHNFFGNSLTTEWWDTIWLNEGFAHLFEFLISDKLVQDGNFDQMHVETLRHALRFDSTSKTRPMTHNVNRPEEIKALFDDIAYDKSGSVLRMFEHAIGKDFFRQGLHDYVQTNALKSVRPDDLYKSLQVAIDNNPPKRIPNIKEAFETWELQKGYPLLHVSYNNETKSFDLTQSHYSSDGQQSPDSLWIIPVNFVTENNPDFSDTHSTFLLKTKSDKIADVEMDNSHWFIFNKQQTGFYRVNYDIENWSKLAATLNSKKLGIIHPSNRAQLIDDSINLAMTGHLSEDLAFGMLTYLRRESNYFPWATASHYLKIFANVLRQNDAAKFEDFKKFMLILIDKIYNIHQVREFQNDNYSDKFGRELAIEWACSMSHESCLNDTFSLVSNHVHLGKKMSKSLERVVLCNGLRHTGKENEWALLFGELLKVTDQEDRNVIIHGLSCTPDQLQRFTETLTFFDYRAMEPTLILKSIIDNSVDGIDHVHRLLMSGNSVVMSKINFEEVVMALANKLANNDGINKMLSLAQRFPTNLDQSTWIKAMGIVEYNVEFSTQLFYKNMLTHMENFLKNFENDDKEPELDTSFRLPGTSKPHAYDIQLNIDLDKRTSEGFVAIDIEVTTSTNVLVLHHRELEIEDVKVFNSKNERVEFYAYYTNSTTEFVMIEFSSKLPEGNFRLEFLQKGMVRNPGSGLYWDSYEMDNETRYLATTQFESDWSRQCFVGYDEPLYKAVFTLSLTYNEKFTAHANTEGTQVDNNNGTRTTKFLPSPIMSSYLVAFIVSDFEINANSPAPGETLHRMLVRPNAVHQSDLGLELSVATLKKLEEYVGLKYELPKMDSAAIPSKGGAMENWGLITYAESALVYPQDLPNVPHRSLVSGASIIAHELAHQFFGNLATTAWWSTTWLNEGFANLFQYFLVQLIHPEWNINFHNYLQMQSVFRSDSYLSTRPMTFEIKDRNDISRSFDSIGYNKAGSVLRMFQFALGETIFREGIRTYLENKKYQAAVAEDLYEGLQTAMDIHNYKDVKFADAFKTWELQKGYPVLTVVHDNSTQSFMMLQSHYLSNSQESSSNRWTIPINFGTKGHPNLDTTLATHWYPNTLSDVFYIKTDNLDFEHGDWFVFNLQQTGYYRVNYDKANWESLTTALKKGEMTKIHEMNRAQLIDDAFDFVKTGMVDLEVALSLSTYLRQETSFLPFGAFERFVNENLRSFMVSEKYDAFKSYMVLLTEKLYNELGPVQKESDDLMNKYAREFIVKWACRMGYKQCLQETNEIVQQVLDNKTTVPDGMKAVTYCAGMRKASQTEFVAMWDKMMSSTDNSEKNTLIDALGCNEHEDLVKSYLQTSVGFTSDTPYTQSQRYRVFNSVQGNIPMVYHVIVDFMLENAEDVSYTYGVSLKNIVRDVGSYAKTEFFANQYKRLLEDKRIKELINDQDFIDGELKTIEDNLSQGQDIQITKILNFAENYVENFDEEEEHGTTEAPETTTVSSSTETSSSTVQPETTTQAPETTTDPGAASTNFISSVVIIASCLIYLTNFL